MMFSIKQKDINDKLQSISAIVEQKSTSEAPDKILDCVFFEVTSEKVRMTASSADMQVSTQIAGNFSEETLSFSVNARSLAEIVRILPAILDISFKIEDGVVNITSGKNRYKLTNFIQTPYPVLNIKSTETLFTLPSKQFQSALDSVSFSMGVHHLRYSLSGCMIQVQKEGIVFVSTDTHRMSHFNIKTEVAEDINRSMILPKKALLYIDKVLGTNSDSASACYGEGDFFIVDSGDYHIVSKLIVGAYPEYDRVFSNPMKHHMVCDTQVFKETLQRVAVFALDKFRTVRFSLDKNQLFLSSKSLVNETASSEMEVEYEGDPIAFNFNANYFVDLFNHFDEKRCTIAFIDESQSVIVSFEGNTNFKYILMPLRV